MPIRFTATTCILIALAVAGCVSATQSRKRTTTPVPRTAATLPQSTQTQAKPMPETATPTSSPIPMIATTIPTTQPYVNSQYHFTCAIPKDYVITDEKDGPGTILTLSQTTLRATLVPASLSVRIYPIGNLTLEQYIDRHIIRDLLSSKGVTHWEKAESTHGEHKGVDILINRQYASGEFKSQIFCFTRGTDVIWLSLTTPMESFDLSQTVVKDFASSFVF